MSAWSLLSWAYIDIMRGTGCSPEEAQEGLLADLISGQREAVGTKAAAGTKAPLSVEAIQPAWWVQAAVISDYPRFPRCRGEVVVDFRGNSIWNGVERIYSDIRVSQVKETVEDLGLTAPTRKNKGGRPAKFTWDLFWIEIVRIALLDGELPGQTEMQKRMLDWTAENWPEEPQESEIRKRLSKLFNTPGIVP
jgi:hypothetical protein